METFNMNMLGGAVDGAVLHSKPQPTSILYKWGMSPLLWAAVVAAAVGGYLLLRRG